MANVRIVATKAWYRKAIAALRDAESTPTVQPRRIIRELERAVDRAGLASELQGDEVRTLAEALPGDEIAETALLQLEAGLERDRARRARLREIQSRWPRETDTSLDE